MTTASQNAAWAALGLSRIQYDRILQIMGREPSPTELAMFSVEWSEHCGYPRSKRYLSQFPREGRYEPVVGTDAGGIQVAGRLVLFKVESHNHPSQVEPKSGAATGVGGILRDIVSMGARPVALLNALKFGTPGDVTTRFIVRGVVDGIQAYGNCVGVPTVGGEVLFDQAYSGNCLVNVMCVGVAEPDMLMTSQAKPGHPVMYLGSRTGRDGIGGCSVLASAELSEDLSQRPTVQIGDPFSGKCLIEATLEAIRSGALVSLKDMGAAGLTCTTAEMADAGQCGMEVELQNVPRREDGMQPFEVMMSESQERMLAVVQRGREAEVAAIFHRWGLQAETIGETVPDPLLIIRDGGEVVARLPVRELTHPELIELPTAEPSPPAAQACITPSEDWTSELLKLLSSANIASRRWIFEQYDSMVQTATSRGPGDADAAVIRMEGTPAGLAVTMDSCPRYAMLDPYLGAMHAVAEACRNVSCVGAWPAGLTDNLNFANPDKPDRFWTFVRSVQGVADACKAFGVPVVSGNVSFYNESPRGPILPTATVGVVGVLEDVGRHVGSGFTRADATIMLLGPVGTETFDGSEYAAAVHGVAPGGRPPALDLDMERKVQDVVRSLIHDGLVSAAHDCSEGGLLVAIAEACLAGTVGAEVDIDTPDLALACFGEAPSRIVLEVTNEDAVLKRVSGVPIRRIGRTGGDALRLRGSAVELDRLRAAYESLPQVLGL